MSIFRRAKARHEHMAQAAGLTEAIAKVDELDRRIARLNPRVRPDEFRALVDHYNALAAYLNRNGHHTPPPSVNW